jgi:very-short-patch-repair endonuclease
LDGEVYVLDIAWPGEKVAVEADGQFVRQQAYGKFTHERHRANVLLAHGWRVPRVTAAMDDAMILSDVGRILRPDRCFVGSAGSV